MSGNVGCRRCPSDVDSLYIVLGGGACMVLAAVLTLRVTSAEHRMV